MFSKGLKKRLAVLLTGVMVLGMTVTAFAGETSGTQSSQGSGNFEGHVNRQIVDVTLPTVSTNYSPFSFVYDGEGLIKDTSHAAYGDDVDFGNATSNVYFRTGDKTYSDKSTKFTVSNNSSVSVNIALQVDVTPGAKDPVLLSSNTLPTGDDAKASIYLGLIVTGNADAKNGDKADTYVVSENMIKKTFCVAGMPENYTVSANKATDDTYPHTYTFKKDETKTDWKKIEFQLEGAANKVKNAKGATAPNLKVTWSFEPTDKLDEESGSTTPTEIFTAGSGVGQINYVTAKVSEVTKVELTNSYGTYDAMKNNGTYYSAATSSANASTGVTTITFDTKFNAFFTGEVDAVITYKDASGTVATKTIKLNMGN